MSKFGAIMVVKQPISDVRLWKNIQSKGYEFKDFLESFGCYYINFSIGKFKDPATNQISFPVVFIGFDPGMNDVDDLRLYFEKVFHECEVLDLHVKERNFREDGQS